MSDDAHPDVIRVLICDDHDAIRALLHLVVELGENMSVVGDAADGQIAIDEAERLQPDVILLDLSMPVLTGLDALPGIRRAAPDAAIVVFSGFATANVAAEMLALGAACYLQKGASPAVIIATIARVHSERVVTTRA
jgi:DNA-binding NarL/FixJ family response regulator